MFGFAPFSAMPLSSLPVGEAVGSKVKIPIEIISAVTSNVVVDRKIPVEFKSSVVLATRKTPVEVLGHLLKVVDIPIENIATLNVTGKIPVEYTAEILKANKIPVEHIQGVVGLRKLPVERLVEILRTNNIPVEVGSDVIIVNRNIPIEIIGQKTVPVALKWVLNSRGDEWVLDSRTVDWILNTRSSKWDIK
jgi:hypothetical protein